tara:strand:- start:109 stop:507 length:399 start_codon:yes stop_codon:yes gene_type:complete
MVSYNRTSIHQKENDDEYTPLISRLSHKWFLVSSIIFSSITFMVIIFDKTKRNKIYSLFFNKLFLFNFLVMISFSTYVFNIQETDTEIHKLKKSIKIGIIGFLIGMIHYVELKIAPFWLLFITSYYLDIDSQ